MHRRRAYRHRHRRQRRGQLLRPGGVKAGLVAALAGGAQARTVDKTEAATGAALVAGVGVVGETGGTGASRRVEEDEATGPCGQGR